MTVSTGSLTGNNLPVASLLYMVSCQTGTAEKKKKKNSLYSQSTFSAFTSMTVIQIQTHDSNMMPPGLWPAIPWALNAQPSDHEITSAPAVKILLCSFRLRGHLLFMTCCSNVSPTRFIILSSAQLQAISSYRFWLVFSTKPSSG
jgi:hypothetical protein